MCRHWGIVLVALPLATALGVRVDRAVPGYPFELGFLPSGRGGIAP